MYKGIATAFVNLGVAFFEPVPMPQLKRILAGWKDPKLYNIGMRSRKAKGSFESYQQRMGSTAQLTLTPSDGYNYTQGHSFGEGYDEILGRKMLLGISPGSKVWSVAEGNLPQLREWLSLLGQKIADPENDKREIPLSKLDCGIVVSEFPCDENSNLLFADWDGRLYERQTRIAFVDMKGFRSQSFLLISCSIKVNRSESSRKELVFHICKDSFTSKIVYRIDPSMKYDYAADATYNIVRMQNDSIVTGSDFLALLDECHINFVFDDLSKLVGRTLFDFKFENANFMSNEVFKRRNWTIDNVDINSEYFDEEKRKEKEKENDTRLSIHEYVIEEAKRQFDVVYYDHGSGEVADVLAFKKDKIMFFHCKKQNGSTPSTSISEIYEVCGQAVKSVAWTHHKLLMSQLQKRSQSTGNGKKWIKGNFEELKNIFQIQRSPVLAVEIVIVHPGLKTENLTPNQKEALTRIKHLLSSCVCYLASVGPSTLTFWSS